jgi:hypothetical protein
MKMHMKADELLEAYEACRYPNDELDDRMWLWVNRNELNPHAPGWQYDILAPPKYSYTRKTRQETIQLLRNTTCDE